MEKRGPDFVAAEVARKRNQPRWPWVVGAGGLAIAAALAIFRPWDQGGPLPKEWLQGLARAEVVHVETVLRLPNGDEVLRYHEYRSRVNRRYLFPTLGFEISTSPVSSVYLDHVRKEGWYFPPIERTAFPNSFDQVLELLQSTGFRQVETQVYQRGTDEPIAVKLTESGLQMMTSAPFGDDVGVMKIVEAKTNVVSPPIPRYPIQRGPMISDATIPQWHRNSLGQLFLIANRTGRTRWDLPGYSYSFSGDLRSSISLLRYSPVRNPDRMSKRVWLPRRFSSPAMEYQFPTAGADVALIPTHWFNGTLDVNAVFETLVSAHLARAEVAPLRWEDDQPILPNVRPEAYQASIVERERTLVLVDQLLPNEIELQAEVRSDLAELYDHVGQLPLGRQRLDEARRIADRTNFRNPNLTARIYRQLKRRSNNPSNTP